MGVEGRWPARLQRGPRSVSLLSRGENISDRKIFQAAEQAQHGAAARAALMAVRHNTTLEKHFAKDLEGSI